jgi:hypothetical protein
MEKFELLKGFALFNVAMSVLLLCVGVALVYIVPDYVIKALNDTAVFSVSTVNTANTQLGLVRGAGFAVIIISVIWLIISVVAGVGGNKTG